MGGSAAVYFCLLLFPLFVGGLVFGLAILCVRYKLSRWGRENWVLYFCSGLNAKSLLSLFFLALPWIGQ